MDLIGRIFQRECSLQVMIGMLSSHRMQSEIIIYDLEALTFLLDNIYIRFGSKLYRQIVGVSESMLSVIL